MLFQIDCVFSPFHRFSPISCQINAKVVPNICYCVQPTRSENLTFHEKITLHGQPIFSPQFNDMPACLPAHPPLHSLAFCEFSILCLVTVCSIIYIGPLIHTIYLSLSICDGSLHSSSRASTHAHQHSHSNCLFST